MAHKFPFSRKDVLDSEKRSKLLPARQTLQALGLKFTDRLVDVGCGTGYFSLAAATLVGPDGQVLGLDVQAEFVDHARRRITEGLGNLRFELSEENRLPCADEFADAVLISAVLHETESPTEFLVELKRVLTRQGRLMIVEWLPKKMDMGPPLAERIVPDELVALLVSCGFDPGEPIDLGQAHYGIVANVKP